LESTARFQKKMINCSLLEHDKGRPFRPGDPREWTPSGTGTSVSAADSAIFIALMVQCAALMMGFLKQMRLNVKAVVYATGNAGSGPSAWPRRNSNG